MPTIALRALEEIGSSLVLAPERFCAEQLAESRAGVPLGEIVVERRVVVSARATASAIVLDTTHARDGLLDVSGALRASSAPAASPKKSVHVGDVLVSRLRPYLRQIALAHPSALRGCEGRALCCSTEFYVLGPRDEGASLAFLLPFLLDDRVQRVLRAAQEGGHHPRVPRETLMSLRVPSALLRERAAIGLRITRMLGRIYAAHAAYRHAVTAAGAEDV
jgi:hypothetical protein